MFSGFSPTGLAFLDELGRSDKRFFESSRATYAAEIMEPAKAFAVALGAALRERFGEGLSVEPRVRGSISPINRDLRFAKDAHPYKDHLMFNFWEGAPKNAAPTLRVRLSRESVGFASGAMFTPPMLKRWRQAVDGAAGRALAKEIAGIVKKRSADVAGQELKRVPAPYDPDHPRADLLRHKALQVRWPEPTPRSVSTPRFVEFCAGRLAELSGVHRWLVKHLA